MIILDDQACQQMTRHFYFHSLYLCIPNSQSVLLMISTSVSYLSTSTETGGSHSQRDPVPQQTPAYICTLCFLVIWYTYVYGTDTDWLCIRTACVVLYLCIQVFRHQMCVSSTPSGTSPPNTASNIAQSHSLTSHHGKVPFRENVVDAGLQASNVWYEFESTIYFVRVAILTIFVRTLHYRCI